MRDSFTLALPIIAQHDNEIINRLIIITSSHNGMPLRHSIGVTISNIHEGVEYCSCIQYINYRGSIVISEN